MRPAGHIILTLLRREASEWKRTRRIQGQGQASRTHGAILGQECTSKEGTRPGLARVRQISPVGFQSWARVLVEQACLLSCRGRLQAGLVLIKPAVFKLNMAFLPSWQAGVEDHRVSVCLSGPITDHVSPWALVWMFE